MEYFFGTNGSLRDEIQSNPIQSNTNRRRMVVVKVIVIVVGGAKQIRGMVGQPEQNKQSRSDK